MNMFKCEYCSKEFKTTKGRLIHIILKHYNEKFERGFK